MKIVMERRGNVEEVENECIRIDNDGMISIETIDKCMRLQEYGENIRIFPFKFQCYMLFDNIYWF